ncbi:MAG TPA: hypothetical protein VMI94_09685 [Bryobacteraceae bacterium]|nr:hypothetical protein [Bryobacteraceae bacterium]
MPGDPESRPLFTALAQPSSSRWLSLVYSLALHAVIIGGVLFVYDSTRPVVEANAPRYSVRFIRFRPTTLFAPVRPPAPADKARRQSAMNPDPARKGGLEPPPGLRRFEVPRLTVRVQSAQILLQPDFPVSVPLKNDLRLPELLSWKPSPPQPAPAMRKMFVAQKLPAPLPQWRNLPAPPVLRPPNREPQAVELPFTGANLGPAPLLPLDPGTTSPIRTQASGSPGPVPQVLPVSPNGADTPNLVSIPDIPVPPVGLFQLPGGSHAPPGQASAGGGSGPPAKSGGAPAGGNANAALTTLRPENAGSARGAGSPGHGAATGPAASTVEQFTDSAYPGRRIQKVVLPPDGHFNVQVESSGAEAFDGTEGVLSGKTVYTVYVKAGKGKEWILQYCLPQAVEQSLTASAARYSLEAPFPYLILRPELDLPDDVDYVIVRGAVTTEGQFAQLAYVTAPEQPAEKDVLLRFLAQWQLRPGKLNGQPTAVEILLIIPADRG